jgi:predicted CXXCH cytochrome family protein
MSQIIRHCLPLIAAMALLAPVPARAQTAPAANACLTCHATQTDARLATPARLFSGTDVHRERGFACADCHGGDPAAGDKARAHDAATGFKGAPKGQAQIATCARCHSDADLMRRFAPKQRVDQAAEYATSVHGKQLAAGHGDVATCASCHGPHGIRLVRDAKSPVFPTNVAATCATCHADPRHMAGYTLPGGAPLPTSQLADYTKSVHYAALTKGNDLSAPTCNDCHGNHGATPPGVGAVANVCGTCHAVFATKFQTSVHAQIFDKACVECHGNHAVLKPSDAMLGATGHAVCATCHSGADDKGAMAADAMHGQFAQLESGIKRSGELIGRVKNAGIEVSDQELALREAATKLTLARTEMHAFDPARVAPIIAEGTKIVASVDAAGQSGAAELRFRRSGLAISLGAILLFVVALGFKLRQIERRSHH